MIYLPLPVVVEYEVKDISFLAYWMKMLYDGQVTHKQVVRAFDEEILLNE